MRSYKVPFHTAAPSNDVTLEAAEKDRPWRHCIEISMQRPFEPVLRMHLDQVFTMMSSLQRLDISGESQPLHTYK